MNTMRRIGWLTVLTWAWVLSGMLPGGAKGDGLIVIDRPVPVPGIPTPTVTPLHVEQHHVSVTIDGQLATTSVDQVFYNPSGQRLEGTYLFPLPEGATIDRFSMDIEGKQVEAELLDAEKARQIYEDIVRKARDPALMEYVGRGAIKVRIFPIEPNSRKPVKLRYTQLLKNDAGTVGYMYPLNTEKFSSAPLHSVSIKVEVKCNDPIKTIYSPSHPVEVTRHGDKRAVVGFEAKNVKPDTDFHLYFAPQPDDKPIGVTLLTYHDGKEDPTGSKDGYFLLLASPGAVDDEKRIVPKDIVFVLDTSGSMAEGGKLDQAKKALRFCIENLNPQDRFEIIRFSTETEPLFGKLSDAGDDNRNLARQFIDQFKPIGGTAIHEALTLAAAYGVDAEDGKRPATVIFLTDGRPTIGTTDEDAIVSAVVGQKRNRPFRIFSFGVGTDLNTHLLDKLTEKMRGYSTYVLPEEDIEVKLSGFYSRIASPVLAGVTLDFGDAVRVSRMYPQAGDLPDLFKGDQLVAVGRYAGDGHASLTLKGQMNGTTRSFVHEGVFAKDRPEHDFIPRLWATRRIGYLLDEIRLHGEKAELKDEVTKLARHYGIVTPYTSYLILEDEAMRGVPMARQTLREMAADAPVMAEAGESYRDMSVAKSGRPSVAGATSNSGLKQAERLDAYQVANAAAEPSSAKLRRQAESQTRYVKGRAFYQNGEEWIDANVQGQATAKVVEVEFNSEAYFTLARRHPDVANWLSVGPNVQVFVDGVVYQVRQGS